METHLNEALLREPASVKPSRAGVSAAALALALLFTLTGCETDVSQPSTSGPALASRALPLSAGDGKLQPGEQCDDGNTTDGDGCSATGTLESGYLCNVPGRPCSAASLCGNGTINPGEACDDGNTTDNGNGCSATCDLSLCGNGTGDNRAFPSFAQEICDDGNRFEGDGCSRLCEVEPGFACSGNPSRCVRAGLAFFNTGVDAQNRRLETGKDPHWFYVGTTTGADPGPRDASDWPQELQTARFMAPVGTYTCVYQDFMVPSTTNVSQFRMRLATFNDNDFYSAKVNGVAFSPTIVNNPSGFPWQKNIFREFGSTAAWRSGLNRIELCNDNNPDEAPNAFRYFFVDAYDDRCGDGVISLREECDDGNTTAGDGCNASCGIETGYACTGQPSTCAATCGNGVLNPGEQCDDGNATAGDGCNKSCRVESGYACPTAGSACVQTCGNGAVDPGEQCDDGNGYDSDGCSAACRIERGFECGGAPSACVPLCGNDRMDSGEQCDDGNTTLGDGCSNACTLELGYACPTVGQPCVKTCANGQVDPGEQCDDGNLAPQDGCGSDCRIEPGYACSAPASGVSSCALTCGNGALDVSETCDDGNTKAGDGCSQGCRVETGYNCSGAPSSCVTRCGDGIVAGAEQCDNGNDTAGDGCDPTCHVESGWRCPAPYTACFQTCGNGTVESGEECDDGNAKVGDGCGGTCRVESGYSCGGAPSTCRTSCGDGIVAGTEVCDDGNLSNGDTCTARCLKDVGQSCTASAVCDGVCDPATNTCVPPGVCGNGSVEVEEGCDDGNTANGDGCASTCTVEPEYSCSGSPSSCHVTPVISGPTPGAVLSTATPALSGKAGAGSVVTVLEGSTVLCTTTADDSGRWSCTPSTPLADGPHTVTATASNGAGSTSPESTPVSFTTDTQAPDTTISQGPGSSTEDTSAAFVYASNESGVRYECSLDGEEYAPCQDAYDVKPGEHSLSVRTVDAAGNVDATPAVYTWTVEDTRAFAGGGCSAAPASSWLALLGLMGLRRRSRR